MTHSQGLVGMVVSRVWDRALTRPGKGLILVGIAAGSFGSVSLGVPVYALFCVLFMIGATALVANTAHRPRLRVDGGLPAKAVAGQTVHGRVSVTNEGRFAAYDVAAEFERLPRELRLLRENTSAPYLAPGETVALPVAVAPLRRGLYKLPRIHGYTSFPFNMIKNSRCRREPGTLLVQPFFHPLEGIDVPVRPRYQPGGIALTSRVGESPEYIGNREYRPGDSVRHMDHRAWARLTKPAVREYQEEYYCRLALVLDTYVPGVRPQPRRGYPAFEAAVSLAASVADALANGEYIIDIFAAGPELYVFRAGRHTAHLENVMEILACVEACRSNPFEVVTPALYDELQQMSTVIAVLLDWDEDRKNLIRAAQEAGCQVKVLVVHDGPTTEPLEFVDYAATQLSPSRIHEGGLGVV